MVMSQAAIDALMAQNAANGNNDAEDDELVDQIDSPASDESAAAEVEPAGEQSAPVEEEIDPLAGTLSAQELARVQQMAAAPPPPPTAYAQKLETEGVGNEATGVKARRWSASAATDSDLPSRVQDLEEKLAGLEAQHHARMGDEQLEEMRLALAQVSETMQGLMAALRQLTEQSKGSLGFAAKQSFDCPECHSHGTVSVPIACTACGYESEWGFYPEQK